MSARGFKGWYYKHQNDVETLALIPGRSEEMAFIQVIADDAAYVVKYPREAYAEIGETVIIGTSAFGPKGIHLDIRDPQITLKGELRYGLLTPVAYDIMGAFRHFKMECRHGIVSLRHAIDGEVKLGERMIRFSGGTGYIETDSGTSFPRDYVWTQSNDFSGPCSIMAAVARIPFGKLSFQGCICVVWIDGREYRLATYRGVRVEENRPYRLRLRQGKLRLIVEAEERGGHALIAPQGGRMLRTIHEAASCPVRYRFYERGALLLDERSRRASYEIVR